MKDVQRFYLLLEPKGHGGKARIAIIGRKRMPKTSHEVREGWDGVHAQPAS